MSFLGLSFITSSLAWFTIALAPSLPISCPSLFLALAKLFVILNSCLATSLFSTGIFSPVAFSKAWRTPAKADVPVTGNGAVAITSASVTPDVNKALLSIVLVTSVKLFVFTFIPYPFSSSLTKALE